MAQKPIIWLIDTSIFTNILNVPGKNQHRDEVIKTFEKRIQENNTFLMPYATILETGNHIANCKGDRHGLAKKFCGVVKEAIKGNAPFTPMQTPNLEKLALMLDKFADFAKGGIGLGDQSIIAEHEQISSKFRTYEVRIWSKDAHLNAYS